MDHSGIMMTGTAAAALEELLAAREAEEKAMEAEENARIARN